MSKPLLLEMLRQQTLLCDGGMGSLVQAQSLDTDKDYWGNENCTDILNLSRPDIVRDIHLNYLRAGADVLETNSFGGSPLTLAEFDLANKAEEINRKAAEIAHEAIEQMPQDRPRYVAGSIGPGTRLPSLGHVDYDTLEAALVIQAKGLLAGKVDAFLIETCQDLLQVKAAVNACKLANKAAHSDVPILVQVTIEATGSMLVGSDMTAAAAVIRAMDVPLLGLNCATGPREMAEHIRWLAQNWDGLISCQPNAGLPELVNGKTRYPLSAQEMCQWLERFVEEDGLAFIGGCCGTTPEHIAALDQMLRKRAGSALRPAVRSRTVVWQPMVASLYAATPLRQENSYFSIGERCNANGSKHWRQLQEQHDWDGCVQMGREQMREGSNALDICTAFVGRDEVAEMNEVVKRFTASINAPLVIDSTELPVLEQALRLHGGKAIINSINFEDGEEPARQRLALARKFGCAVIALTIDEEGMAKTAERKLSIAHRLYRLAVEEYGLPPQDLLFDPLTFTVATGNEDDRKLGIETLSGISLIAQAMPQCQIILGLSNISFGLSPAARHVLNSVYLDHALKAGLTGAIVHFSKILPLHKLTAEEISIAEDLIFDRRKEGYDPLQAFIALFMGRTAVKQAAKTRPDTIEEVLKQRIVDGDRNGLEDDLRQALINYQPLAIINDLLLDGMKVVGDLFASGKMQLPFVLQSAETMKSAVAFLEPLMEKADGQNKGTIVLATVKGDVHDIGKNLVDIILTNNGYKVINLGIKQPIVSIIHAAREHAADAVGMSGLLVKSTVIMRENLEEMSREGLSVPVLLGGAALTRSYVEDECVAAYGSGRVAYAGDAFDGLTLMNRVMAKTFDDYLAAVQAKRQGRSKNTKRILGQAATSAALPFTPEQARQRRLENTVAVPAPPFWGAKNLEHVPIKTILPYLNERMLFQLQWGYRKDGRSFEDFLGWAKQELRPLLLRLLREVEAENIVQPQAAYGYWPCAGDADDLVVFAPDNHQKEIGRFHLPRQADGERISIVDYVKDIADPQRDVLGLQVVTMGQRVADIARDWFAANRYQDYLYLHGLGVELTEALAEYVHARVRSELGFSTEDAREMDKLLQQGYRGSRYSFGYPACPRLEDQELILQWLEAEKIGIALSDEFQLHPEQSTSAIILHHPGARYFSV